MRRLDDGADGHDVSFRDDVLLDVMQVRECGDDGADEPPDVLATLDGPEGAAVPLHVGREVVGRSICVVLVERRFYERANDPLVSSRFSRVVMLPSFSCVVVVVLIRGKLGWPIDSPHQKATTSLAAAPAR